MSGVLFWKQLIVLLLVAVGAVQCEGQNGPTNEDNGFKTSLPSHFLTNTVQFQTLPASDYLDECAFHLQGVVTLVDTNRNLLVLQDATGALAVHYDLQGSAIQVGELVSLEGTNCYPYVVSFPAYPYHPSGWEIRTSFEAPTDWGEYYLTRMRGCLHPPVTGEYTFWIASDNSSELWLSQNDLPSKARKIASIPQYGYVDPHEWSRYPSQRSESILLKAGATYYIEALQEQMTKADNLAVAWQGPGLKQSVIDGRYLAPWNQSGGPNRFAQTNGILREYWTNYSGGDLTILASSMPFESALTVEKLKVSILGKGKLPEAELISFRQPLPLEKNFRWVRVEGIVSFVGINEDGAFLELSDGESRMQVRVLHCEREFARNLFNLPVRVEGVCEGGHDQEGALVPGLLWTSTEKHISMIGPGNTNLNAILAAQSLKPVLASTNPVMEGFYVTHGVVTFNDRVFGKNCLFVQGDTAAISVSLQDRHFKKDLVVGEWLDLGGSLRPGKNVPIMNPMAVTELGWRSMPEPITQPVQLPMPGSRDGRWTEIEGVVHSVNTNGTLSVFGKDGPVNLWVGQTPSNSLSSYVDAKLRVRGVLSLTMLNSPLLLIPSPSFVHVEEDAPKDPFAVPLCSIAELPSDTVDPSSVHRARIRGGVIYSKGRSVFIQDASGGILAQVPDNTPVKIGETVEAVGFPAASSSARRLIEAILQVTGSAQPVEPDKLDITETLSPKQSYTLVQAAATLLNEKAIGSDQVLELEEHRRIFTATLSDAQNSLPLIAPGSRVQVTGVFEDGAIDSPVTGKAAVESTAAGSLNILLRNPADVVVLNGPPWWTLKRTVALVGTLLIVLVVTLLWAYLLRRRLDRQQAARLAFSRQILQGQESERQRIAANLHDSLGQDLLVIKNQARLAMQPMVDEADRQNRLNKISEITSQAIAEVRQITYDLRPYQLDRLGLTQAIRAVVSQASENSPILIATYLDAIDGIFDKESEIHLYRIIQEALNNILKHSAATEAAVVVKSPNDLVSLSIRDNGRGFDADAAGSSSVRDIGYGLRGMRERTRILGGRFMIDSHPAQGTSITIEIPKPISKT